jgi:hypothetical protein
LKPETIGRCHPDAGQDLSLESFYLKIDYKQAMNGCCHPELVSGSFSEKYKREKDADIHQHDIRKSILL